MDRLRFRQSIVVLVLCVLGALSTAARAIDLDRWFVVELQGSKAGWMHERVHEQDGLVHSTTTFHLGIRRGETTISVTLAGGFVETADGAPVRMWSRQELGTTPLETAVTWRDDGTIEIETTQDGRTQTSTRDAPNGTWLTPEAARDYVAQRLATGAERIVVRTIDPLGGITPMTVTRDRIKPATVEVAGRAVPAHSCVTTSSSEPGIEATEHIDQHGRVVRTEMDLGSMRLLVLAADKALALAELDPPELMRSTFVEPSRRIESPRRARTATYILRVPDGEIPALASAASQRHERINPRTVRVTVRSNTSTEAGDDQHRYLQPSAMLAIGDPKIVSLAKRGRGEQAELAESLRRVVHGHVRQKGLSVGFASASEVVRTREGDCTEHATLLAAVLRNRGIPSRVVSGLIYADRFAGASHIFGYHMWTQAMVEIDGELRWIDLDATLPAGTPFDATHIALAFGALNDDEPNNALVPLVPLLGRLEIEVVDVGY